MLEIDVARKYSRVPKAHLFLDYYFEEVCLLMNIDQIKTAKIRKKTRSLSNHYIN